MKRQTCNELNANLNCSVFVLAGRLGPLKRCAILSGREECTEFGRL